MVWIQFFVCAVMILVSGSRLSRYADMLAEKSGMGRTWIGLTLLATITSLPELGTGISSVRIVGAPDIAVGAVLGSCVFNLMLIGLIDLFYRPAPILSHVDQGHILSGGFGVFLLGITAWGFLLNTSESLQWMFWIGPYTPVILVVYFLAVRTAFRYEQKRMVAYIKEEAKVLQYDHVPIKKVYFKLLFHSSVVVGAGIWLAFVGNQIAEITGWGQTFVGSLLIAASTSLPEIVTSFTALRLAAPDMAIANLFGSNLFNILILAIDDMIYMEGPLLSKVSSSHQFSAVTAMMMTGIAMTGLIYRTEKKAWASLSWDGMCLITLYLLNAYLLFASSRGY